MEEIHRDRHGELRGNDDSPPPPSSVICCSRGLGMSSLDSGEPVSLKTERTPCVLVPSLETVVRRDDYIFVLFQGGFVSFVEE